MFIKVVPAAVRVVGVGVMTVEKFDDMKSAAIDIEMDVTLLKIRRDSFPDFYFGMKLFDLAPCCIADAFAVCLRRYEKYFKITAPAVGRYYDTADFLSVEYDAVRFAAVDRMLYRFTRDYLIVFFLMIVAQSEFLKRAVIERFLIIEYELLAVVRL